MQVAFGQIGDSLLATRPAASSRAELTGATRVHAKHLATTEEPTRNPSATGTVGSFLLKLRATGRRAALSQVARFYSSDF